MYFQVGNQHSYFHAESMQTVGNYTTTQTRIFTTGLGIRHQSFNYGAYG